MKAHLLKRWKRQNFGEIRWNKMKGDLSRVSGDEMTWNGRQKTVTLAISWLPNHIYIYTLATAGSHMEVLVYWCPFILLWTAVASSHRCKSAECETLITVVSCSFHAIKKYFFLHEQFLCALCLPSGFHFGNSYAAWDTTSCTTDVMHDGTSRLCTRTSPCACRKSKTVPRLSAPWKW